MSGSKPDPATLKDEQHSSKTTLASNQDTEAPHTSNQDFRRHTIETVRPLSERRDEIHDSPKDKKKRMQDDSGTDQDIFDARKSPCFKLIFAYLTINEIIRSERSSRAWRDTVRRYLSSVENFHITHGNSTHSVPDRERAFRTLIIHKRRGVVKKMIEKMAPYFVRIFSDSIDEEGAREIVIQCPKLQYLVLYGNCTKRAVDDARGLMSPNLVVSGAFLKKIRTKLRTLSFTCLPSLREEYLSRAVSRFSDLTRLDLNHNSIEIFRSVSSLLEHMPSLEHLSLMEYEMDESEFVDVPRFEELRLLQELHLWGNEYVNPGWLVAAAACESLRVLNVGACPLVTTESVVALCKSRFELTELVVSKVPLSDTDLRVCLRYCKQLILVDVSWCCQLTRKVLASVSRRRNDPLVIRARGTDLENNTKRYEGIVLCTDLTPVLYNPLRSCFDSVRILPEDASFVEKGHSSDFVPSGNVVIVNFAEVETLGISAAQPEGDNAGADAMPEGDQDPVLEGDNLGGDARPVDTRGDDTPQEGDPKDPTRQEGHSSRDSSMQEEVDTRGEVAMLGNNSGDDSMEKGDTQGEATQEGNTSGDDSMPETSNTRSVDATHELHTSGDDSMKGGETSGDDSMKDESDTLRVAAMREEADTSSSGTVHVESEIQTVAVVHHADDARKEAEPDVNIPDKEVPAEENEPADAEPEADIEQNPIDAADADVNADLAPPDDIVAAGEAAIEAPAEVVPPPEDAVPPQDPIHPEVEIPPENPREENVVRPARIFPQARRDLNGQPGEDGAGPVHEIPPVVLIQNDQILNARNDLLIMARRAHVEEDGPVEELRHNLIHDLMAIERGLPIGVQNGHHEIVVNGVRPEDFIVPDEDLMADDEMDEDDDDDDDVFPVRLQRGEPDEGFAEDGVIPEDLGIFVIGPERPPRRRNGDHERDMRALDRLYEEYGLEMENVGVAGNGLPNQELVLENPPNGPVENLDIPIAPLQDQQEVNVNGLPGPPPPPEQNVFANDLLFVDDDALMGDEEEDEV